MKKILLLMLTLVMSVATWAAKPYYKILSGGFLEGNVVVEITFPDATTLGMSNNYSPVSIAHQDWDIAEHGYRFISEATLRDGNITIEGNKMVCTFPEYDPLPGVEKYSISAWYIVVDGVNYTDVYGYINIYEYEPEPTAEPVDGSLTSGSMTVMVTFPKATTVTPDLGSNYTISLWNNGNKLDAKTKDSEVTANGNTISTTFNFIAQSSDDLSTCTLNIDGYSINIDGSYNTDALSFPVTLNNGDDNDDEPGTGDGDEPGDDETPDETNYFWVNNTTASDVTIVVDGEYGSIEYTYTPDNKNSWVAVGNDVKVIYISSNSHEKVYFRAGESGNTTMNGVFMFESRSGAPYSVGGDITTLLDRAGNVTTLTERETFAHMFASDKYLSDASELVLPSTTLSPSCYAGMFAAWESGLQAGPKALPATNLAEECYESMFANCSLLTTAPELPATTLAANCYNNMFYECRSLQKAPVLPATKLVEGCYYHMFYNCSGLEPVIFAYIDDYDDRVWGTNYNYTFGNPMYEWVSGATAGMTIYTNLKNWVERSRNDILGSTYAPLINREIMAKEDPDNKTTYYTTFYDSEFAYVIPEGITAYTATISGSNLVMTPIEGGIIPAGEGVLLKLNDDEDSHDWYNIPQLGMFYMSRTPQNVEKNAENVLTGTDVSTVAPANCYVLSYGQNQLGFYKYTGDIDANKAYFIKENGARSLRMVFAGEESVDGIENVELSTESRNGIFSINGARLSQPQKGLNIINGRKVLVK